MIPSSDPPVPQPSTAAKEPRVRSLATVIVFARYPEAGKVKTRLIPALGPDRAAQLHQRLSARMMHAAFQFRHQTGADIAVYHAGGDLAAMCHTFGSHFDYRPQHGEDLGERLQRAVGEVFRQGAAKAMVVGTDCPDLDERVLNEASLLLDKADVVLGPALDGGYYLIGCRAPCPQLFENIDWGTDRVLAQTIQLAKRSGLHVRQLHPLSDVDYVEDLVVCRRRVDEYADLLPSVEPGLLSVVIPARNEASRIGPLLRRLAQYEHLERIVVDGGSEDSTLEIARQEGATTLSVPRGRGPQLNAGAVVSRGEALLFLHADSQLPDNFDREIRSLLTDEVSLGAFRLQIDAAYWPLRWIEAAANVRSRLRGLPYGDQGMFLRSDRFFQAGGFPNWPLMEDYELSRRMRRLGRIAISTEAVVTSSRRWARRGVWRTTAFNQWCVAAFHLGVSPERLAKWYYGR